MLDTCFNLTLSVNPNWETLVAWRRGTGQDARRTWVGYSYRRHHLYVYLLNLYDYPQPSSTPEAEAYSLLQVVHVFRHTSDMLRSLHAKASAYDNFLELLLTYNSIYTHKKVHRTFERTFDYDQFVVQGIESCSDRVLQAIMLHEYPQTVHPSHCFSLG